MKIKFTHNVSEALSPLFHYKYNSSLVSKEAIKWPPVAYENRKACGEKENNDEVLFAMHSRPILKLKSSNLVKLISLVNQT